MAGIKLEWLDPIQGASPLAPTNSQPLPSDATELMKRYHDTMPVQVQEWWADHR